MFEEKKDTENKEFVGEVGVSKGVGCVGETPFRMVSFLSRICKILIRTHCLAPKPVLVECPRLL